MIQRFTEVLLKRPRPGTALDRVYSHHLQNGTLDEFLQSLDVDETTELAAGKQLVLGLIQLRRGLTAPAVAALSKAERGLENDAMASFYLGRALFAVGKTDQAAQAMQRAIDRGPPRLEAAEVYLELGRLYSRSGKSEQAIKTWNQLQQRFPGDRSIGERIARCLVDEKHHELALEHYVRLADETQNDQQRVQYQIQTAQLQRILHRPDQANEQLERLLLRLRPGSWLYRDVRDRLEAGILRDGSYSELADFYWDLSKRSPDDLTLRVRLGQILSLAGKFDLAQRTLQFAVDRAPQDTAARIALIDVLDRADRPAAASSQLESLAAIDPDNPDLYIRWGRMLLRDADKALEERHDAAVDVWQRLLETRPDDPGMHVRVAKLVHGIGRTDTAIALYRKAVDLDPEAPQYREYLAELLHESDRFDEAIEVWRSMATGPRRGRDSLVRLAEVLSAFDYRFQSLQAWSQAAAFDLTFSQQLRYARALIDAQEYDQAVRLLEGAGKIAETRDEQRQVLREQVDAYAAGEMLTEKIASLSHQTPSTENRLLLAMLHLANQQLGRAAMTIEDAVEQSPAHLQTLAMAADLAQRQRRWSDATGYYQRLIELDGRFQTTYLRNIVTLQQEARDLDKALQFAGDLIDAAPTVPDSYRIYADIAWALGRDEDAVAALRNAIDVAPRDNGNRIKLAEHFAGQFQTTAAIDLYWEAMEYARDWKRRRELFQALVPLYQRRGASHQLLRRLEQFELTTDDRHQTQWLVASFWQSMGDFKRASFLLRQLVDQQPADAELLRQTVACLMALSDYATALKYQRDLVDLSRMPADYDLLAELEFKRGELKQMDVFAIELAATTDPVRAMTIIDRAAVQSPSKAIELCRIVTRRQRSWWGIQSVQAQLLFRMARDADDDRMEQAIRLAEGIDALNLNLARPPRCKPPGVNAGGNYVIQFSPHPRSSRGANSGKYTLPRRNFTLFLRVLFDAASPSSATRPAGHRVTARYLIPQDYNQARWIARAIKVLGRHKQYERDGRRQSVRQVIEELFPMPPADQIDDPRGLEELLAMDGLERSLAGTSAGPSTELLWRMAEVDPAGELPGWRAMLDARGKRRRVEGDRPTTRSKTLDEAQLHILANVVSTRRKLRAGLTSPQQIGRELELYRWMIQEFRLAGKEIPALDAGEANTEANTPTSSLLAAIAEIQTALWENDLERADNLVSGLTEIARRDPTSDLLAQLQSCSAITWFASPSGASEVEFQRSHRNELLDAWIAHCSSRNARRESSQSAAQVVRQYAAGSGLTGSSPANRRLVRLQPLLVKTTLSKFLIDEYLVRGILQITGDDQARATIGQVSLPGDWIVSLEQAFPRASEREMRLRRVVAVFADTWDQRPASSYQKMLSLCEASPRDVDLQIEAAAMQVARKEVDKAFARLSNFETSADSSALKIALAKIFLAFRIGARSSSYDTVEQIQDMQLGTATRRELDQLLYELRAVTLSRSTAQRASRAIWQANSPLRQDDASQLRLARTLLLEGNRVTASEVAFSILHDRLTGDRTPTAAIRRQAMEIMVRAGCIDQLVSMFEREITARNTPQTSTTNRPNSRRDKRNDPRDELAELYQRADQADKATRIWEKMIAEERLSPDAILSRADALRSDRKYHQAAITYLFAFEKDAGLWKSNWSAFVRSAEASKHPAAIYARLSTADVGSYSLFSLCNVIGIRSGDAFSESQRRFVRHLIETHPDVPRKAGLFKAFIPESEWEHFSGLIEELNRD
ncbi:tetratricopeptide repeat protein [Rhodopirellula sp. JC639]|uniref:tetratricopeptide repeat protein n=1 Tax=Stieleria mannarensis TaxID=2755585 RepID=UPI001604A070|nr:tetratricopeptide repeat protein [Rhodopirellula sp. JC639]